ncbi:MAG: hypothetical protein K9N48_03390 [Verrucomicrobia bacterium]|nr:hypothetical protein [Verrucomicrobiota bacterium]MCF7707912.1 hypothetical protein [Verrucomicrobiota bacterium]
MKVVPFVAETAYQAVEKIREELGPQAVVLNVRRLPAEGLSRLWRKPAIEVLACLPDGRNGREDRLDELKRELGEIKRELPGIRNNGGGVRGQTIAQSGYSSGWRIGMMLENTGMLPVHIQNIVDRLHALHGPTRPEPVGRELHLAGALLEDLWPRRLQFGTETDSRIHLLIGAPGVGKSTCLCKWLAKSVLIDGQKAMLWRLDGAAANVAEPVSVYGEILGVPVMRSWRGYALEDENEIGFIDLPGWNWNKSDAVSELSSLIQTWGNPRLHLVLNGAYDIHLQLAQVRAFSGLPLSGIIVTHMDEESRWGKLWNLVLGTNYTLEYISAGQNIPGDFFRPTPELILRRQFGLK